MTMDLPRNALLRIAAPLLLAVALVLSARLEPATPPVELAPGDLPLPDVAEMSRAYEEAVAPGGPGVDLGASRAPVTVVEFSDFGCRYSARFAAQTYPALAAYVARGQVRWKYVPFVLGIFDHGEAAARAGQCAADQGRGAFTRMHDRLFERQGEWQQSTNPAATFRAYARVAELNLARFDACMASAAPDERTRTASALADRMGVRATPTFFINGYRVEGALPPEQFRALLDDALQGSRTN